MPTKLAYIDRQPTSETFRQVLKGTNWSGEFKDNSWAIYCGDALDGLRKIPDDVNCVITSPLYFWLRYYDVYRQYFFDKQPLHDKKVDEDMWTIAAHPKSSVKLDTALLPDKLISRCLDVGREKGGIVLDPFLGSGTTLRVALTNGYSGVGVEFNKKFCHHAAGQLERL